MADAGMTRVSAGAITSLLTDSFVAAGLPAVDAARCAELMTEADLTGAEGHGILRLPQYVRRLKARGFNAHPNITVTKSAPATALVDGDNGMGHLVMTRAANEAIAMARDTGVAWVGVRRSNHAGPAGLYAEMPTAHGMIGFTPPSPMPITWRRGAAPICCSAPIRWPSACPRARARWCSTWRPRSSPTAR